MVSFIACSGCVERTLRIDSEPAGAVVVLNHREVGVTPCEVEFAHYGTFDVELRKEGYVPFIGKRAAKPKAWDVPGPDLAAELIPLKAQAVTQWNFTLEALPNDGGHGDLLQRAKAIRESVSASENGEPTAPPEDRHSP